MSPTPTSSPVVVELIESSGPEAAPWFGVPLIAGAFLLIGGYLAYLYTRRNERSKAIREQEDALAQEVLETGLALLAAGAALRDFGLLTLRRKPSESLALAGKTIGPMVDTFLSATRRFSITMPPEFQPIFKEYVAATTLLAIPPYQRAGQELMLARQGMTERDLISRMRRMRGLEPLEYEDDIDFSALRPEGLLADALRQDRDAEARMGSESETSKKNPETTVD